MCTLVYLPLLPTHSFFKKYSLFCFLSYIFLFLVFVCVYFGLPPSPSHLCVFFKYSLFCFLRLFFLSLVFVCVYFGLPSSPSHLFCLHNIFDFSKLIYFIFFMFWTPCFANHMFDPCFVAACFGTLHFFTG